jgi:hypothetical protein
MEFEIDKKLVENLKSGNASGQRSVTYSQLELVTKYLDDKKARAIKIDKDCFVVFSEIPNIEFWIKDFTKESQLSFVKDQLDYIDASKYQTNYLMFLIDEFIGGNGFKRLTRLLATVLPIFLFNFFIYTFETRESTQQTFIGLLTAISVFVAIFSLFTISHDYLQRKRLALFEGGNLGYYFSIDKHITKTGIYSIFISIIGLLSSGDIAGKKINNHLGSFQHHQTIILSILLNMAFLGVLIVLRSIIEFYIHRPGRFMMGDLKRDSFKNFTNSL